MCTALWINVDEDAFSFDKGVQCGATTCTFGHSATSDSSAGG